MSAPFRDPNEPVNSREQELRDSVSLWASKRNRRQLDAYTETSKVNPREFSNLNRAVGAEQARSLVGTPRGADLVRKSATFDDLTKHLSRAPKLAEAIEFDPDLRAVAHPDISTLASLEETLRGGVKAAQVIGGQGRAGVADIEASVLGSNEFHSRLLGLDPLTGEQASNLFLAQFRQQSASQELAQAELGEVGTAFATIARASPQLVTGFGAFLGGTLVGGPVVGIALTAAQSYILETGSVYTEWEYGEDPMDRDLQNVFIPAYGIFAATVETIAIGAEAAPIKHALKQAMKAGTKNKALRLILGRFSLDLFRNAIIEGGEETVQAAAQIFLRTIDRNLGDPEGFVNDLLSEETLTSLLQAFKGGATVGAGVGGVRTGLGIRSDIKAARAAAEQEKKFGQDLAEGVSKAEMLDHSPAKFKNLLFQMTEGTPQEDVWIDADTFLDHFSKPENAQALDDLRTAIPDLDEQILEAQNAGSDIVMKTADFATHIAATQHLDGLSDGLRFDPDAPTLAALNQEATERETEALEAEIEREAGTLEIDEQIEVRDSAIATMTDRAVDDLGITRREAEAFATVKVANLMTLAQTENLDPAAFVNAAMGRLPLQKREDVPGPAEFEALQEGVEPLAEGVIPREAPEALAQPVTDVGTVDSPAFKAFFGESKVVDARGAPMPVHHGGGFDVSIDESFDTAGIGVHFGTEGAALDRIGGKPVDDAVASVTTFEEDGKFFYSVEDFAFDQDPEFDEGFATAEEADEAGKQFAQDQAQDRDIDEEGVQITSAFLNLQNPLRLPDLGTWGLSSIIRDLPDAAKLTEAERDQVHEANNQSDEAGFEALKALLESKGFDGIVYRNAVEDVGRDSFIAFRPTQIKSVSNRGTFDPTDPRILRQPAKEKQLPRGFFARFEGGGGLLALTSKANKSTVFHELSHDMFSVMQALAQRSEASPDLQADWAILRDWLGANDEDALTDAQEEVLAETMEVYFEEGNAPTPELQSVFDRISRWMSETYRRVRGRPNADINDDVRAVFERMFATQEAIEAAKADLGFQDVFEGRKPEGMTDAAWERAQARVRNVESEINERAGRRVFRAKLKEVNAAATEVRNSVRKTVTQQLWEDPAYRARSWLRTGKLPDGSELPAEHSRLSWSGILEVLSDLPDDQQQERLATLKLMRLTKKDGMDPEVAAQVLGLDDAAEMLDLMEGVKDQTLTQAIKAETEKQMQEQHPELLVSQEELKAQAEAAILDVDSRVKHMEQTIKALRKLDAESPGRAAAERAAVTTPLGVQEAERRLEVAQRTLDDATRREDVQRGVLTRLALDVRQAEERLRIERRRARRERMAATEATREERARGREALREQREGLRGAAAEALSEERRQSAARLSEIRQGAALATQGLNVGAIRIAAAARVESTSGRKLKSLVANFRIVSQKKTKEAVRTAGRGDYGESADALETVVLANEIVRRGNEAMIRRDKGQRKLVPMTRPKFQGPKLSETKNPSESSRQIWAHTFNLLDRYELRKTTKDVRAVPEPRDTDGKNFQTFRQDYVEKTGELWKGPEFLDDAGHKVSYLDLTVSDFDGLMEGIANLQTWANALTRMSKEEGKESFLEARDEMIGDATAFGTGRSIHIPKGAGSVAERAAKAIDAIYGTINRPIFGFRLLDRQNIQGAFKRNIVDPLKGGAFFRLGFMKSRQEQQNDLFESVYRPQLPEGATTAEKLQAFREFGQISRRFMSKTLAGSREIAGVPLTRNNLIQIMLYWGSPESRAALENAEESPMSEEVVMSLIGKYATKQDRDYVEGIWALPEQDWSALSDLHMRLTGTALRKVEALPFTTPQGWNMTGGYSRMFYESEFSQSNIKKAENKDTLSALTYKGSMTIQTPSGQRKHRKGNAGNQLMLTHTMVWNRQLNETASDLAYAEVVPKVMRFINDKDWRRAVSKALGSPFVQKLHNWVETSVAPQYQPDVAADIWVDRARQAGVMQIIGGRASTVLVQLTGLASAFPRLGRYTFVGLNGLLNDGWARGASRPESGAGPHRFLQAMNHMIELSPPLQFRRQTYDQNANDFISRGKFPSGMSLRFVQWYAGVIGYVDSLVAGSVWAGAYQQAMDGDARAVKEGAVEGDHDLAVKYANDLMEVTQAAAQNLDLASFMRSKNPLWRSLFSFSTWINNRMNLTIEEFSIANQTGGFADWWRFSTYIASTYIIDAAATVGIGYLLAGLRPEDEPRDPDEVAGRMAWSLFSNFNSGYPGASQMNSLLRPVVFGGQIRKLDLGPAGDAAQQPFVALQAAVKASRGEGEWEKAFIEGVHTVGYWYNAPTQNMIDFAEMVLQTEIDKK